MDAWVYDEECYPNLWCATFRHLTTKEKVVFIIDEHQDDRVKLRSWIKGKFILGYNNHSYDDPLMNYVMDFYTTYSLKQIKAFSNKLIVLKDDAYYQDEEIKRYRYKKSLFGYKSIDLLRLLFAKMHWVSLKELEVTMKWRNVQEIPHFHETILTTGQKLEVLSYNDNDTLATEAVAIKALEDIKLRHAILKEFGFECYSRDGVNTGVNLLLKMYCDKTGEDTKEVGERRTVRESINLGEVISDKIHFQSKVFQDLLYKLKNTSIKDTRGEFSFEILYGGVMHGYGTGGIHSRDKSGVIIPPPGYRYMDADVTSLYPSILIEYGFAPEHIDKEIFISLYKFLRDDRVRAKKEGRKAIAETYKLALNGTYGNLMSDYSWLQDPKAAMGVTLNGQLFITMLSEALIDAGIQVDSLNTDGITALVREDQMEDYWRITKEWQEYTRLNLEFREYDKVVRLNVNSYYAIYKNIPFNEGDAGKVKEKGDLSTKIVLGKGFDKPIVKMAVKDYFVKGTPIEETIRNHKDIYDFTMFEKVGSQFEVEWWLKKQQRINRYYASKVGAYLYKVKTNKKGQKTRQHMLKDTGVMIFNVYEEKEMKDYNINYQYYIVEARKLINAIESNQLVIEE